MAADITGEEAEEDSPVEVVAGAAAAAEADSPEVAHRGVGDERNTHSR